MNNGLELRCYAPPNLTAISHLVSRRRMSELFSGIPGAMPVDRASAITRAKRELADQVRNGELRDKIDAAYLPIYREREPLYGPSRPAPPEPEPAA